MSYNIDKKDRVERYVRKLSECMLSNDTEANHSNADTLLTDLLIELGYDDVVDAYEMIEKWYA